MSHSKDTSQDLDALIARIAEIPIRKSLGFEVIELQRGRIVVAMNHKPELEGIYDSFHGGILATLADSAAGLAVFTLTWPDLAITTTDIHIRYLAPCHGRAVATATVLKEGKTLCPVVVDVHDGQGNRVAHATVTYIRLSSLSPGSPAKEECC